MSSYSIDGFCNSLLEVGEVKGWYNASEVPDWAPMNLTTTTINLLMPGIESHYGKDLPVNIHFHILKLGNFGVK